jgi:hypothetical protein
MLIRLRHFTTLIVPQAGFVVTLKFRFFIGSITGRTQQQIPKLTAMLDVGCNNQSKFRYIWVWKEALK